MTKRERVDVYKLVADQMLDALDKGTVPWQKPWNTRGIDGAPKNLVSKKPYRGINLWLLAMMPYGCNLWASYKQVTERGGTFKEGELDKPTIVTLWKPIEVNDRENPGEKKKILFLRYYRVWNLEQTEGLERFIDAPAEEEDESFDPIAEAEGLWEGFTDRPKVSYGSDKAAYFPLDDKIVMPAPETFVSPAEFYSTLFHEGVHSTLHESRLNRTLYKDSYAKEELTAEMGAAYLVHIAGIEDEACFDNSAAYIATWQKRISDDPKIVVQAAARAQKAVDHMMKTFDKVEEEVAA